MKLSTKLKFVAATLVAFMSVACCQMQAESTSPVDYVNPYMGSISHLLVPTFPTVHLPNSMMRVYPNRDDFTTDFLAGLPCIVPDHRKGSYFSITPFVSDEKVMMSQNVELSYEREHTTPYSYEVYLDEEQVEVSFAVSHQSALYSFDFLSKDQTPKIMFAARNGELKVNGNAIEGYENIIGNGNSAARVYLYAEPSADIATSDVKPRGKGAVLLAEFAAGTSNVSLRYGVSFISVEQARKNLEREINDYNVATLAAAGRKIWNEALGKIEVKGGDQDDMKVLYTSLYRTFERPVCISEDGQYFSAFDGKVYQDGGRDYYVDDWLWDTFRATHPLRLLIDHEVEADILNSYITMTDYRPAGNNWFPNFPKITGDSHGMNSNHGVVSVIDAWRKGVRDYDLQKAFTSCRAALEEKTLIPWSGAEAGVLDDFYKEHGYFPALHKDEQETVPHVGPFERRQAVAVTLGTSYDHWCLAQIAGELGMDDQKAHYEQTGLNYRNVFNPESRFFHPKDKDGKFIPNIDYRYDSGRGARHYYDENNGFTYRWEVQHNVADLISLVGGNEKFCVALDSLFTTSLGKSRIDFWTTFGGDQTGNVGQFSMGNEPSFHIPYLYNYAGEPWKTQKRTRSLLKMWFRDDLMGVPGDEDGGGMSAFVVFSQLGFYPVTPGIPMYNITSPVFTYSKVTLSNGATVEIKAPKASADNKYIQSAKLNGKEWNKPWFWHEDIVAGAVIEFEMGKYPNKEWGAQTPPPSGYNN